MHRRIVIILLFLLSANFFYAQGESNFKKFWKLQRPEKWWVVLHPFVASRAMEATQKAKQASDSLLNNSVLDSYKSGGQVDAFRHAYWMALLLREMKESKARRLGVAHEKSNYLSYKKQQREDGQYPDLASKKMDLYNNAKGIEIGFANLGVEEGQLKKIIIDSVICGKMKIIKRDSLGNFLKCNGQIIHADSLNKWNNNKCLIKSNYKE